MVRQTIGAILVSLAVALPAWADSNRPAEIQTLKNAQENLARAKQGAGKPGHAQAVERQQQEVQRLLDQLEAGQNVPSSEVERVLRKSLKPY